MITLYKHRDILELINIAIVISVPLISLILYRTSKITSFLITSLIFTVELILIIYLSEQGYEYPIVANILINVIIIKSTIINHIKSNSLDLKEIKHKLKKNKKIISKSIDEINVECNLQNKYEDEILKLNKEIEKAIEESETPIFVIGGKKENFYSNEAFKKFINEDKVSNAEEDIFAYLNYKFINSNEIIESIKSKKQNSININAYDGKIYRFVSFANKIDNKNIQICILSDITQSTLIQHKLMESEERYKKLMDILNDGVIIHNMNTVNYANNKAIELFDLRNESLDNILVDDMKLNINKKFKQDFMKNMSIVKLNKQEKTTMKLETNQGRIIEFITTSITLNNESMLLSIAIDITDSEKVITYLEQSEKTYKLLLKTLPEGIMIIDKKSNNYIYRNKVMMKLLKDIGVDNLNEVIKDYIDKSEYGVFKKFTLNLEEKTNISVAIIDRIEDETFVVVVRTLDDQYKIEKMEEELNEISDKNKFKTEFLANLTNDIRKPIDTIFTVNNMLNINKDKYNSKYISNYTRLVKQNCYRLIRLLNNVEEIEKADNGIYSMNLKKYDVVKLIKDIVEKSKYYIYEKGLSICFESDVEEKVIIMDKEKIEKIVLNLLSNSIKFTEKDGNIKVSVNAKDDKVRIKVSDTGVGIPEDKMEVIFNNFEQVDRTLSRGAEGSGIGLSLVKKLVNLHKGEISVESKLGKGSQFEITLNNNEVYDTLNKDIELGYNLSDNEKIDIEFSDIYFDVSS
ncbi:ATP-binding protein [Faecalimicrobium sp. JNUCC 81]